MKHLLKTHFGYDHFRPLQEEIIANVLSKKDTFVLMSTGGGKSLCYQLPALKFEGITLVISPLIALMKDQVDSLKANGIAAEYLNSSLQSGEIARIQQEATKCKIKILYIAPERLTANGFSEFLQQLNVSLIAIDEAHCISEWGHDFRPDYRNLKMFRTEFPNIPIVALTATATPKVRKDILAQLNLPNAQTFLSSFNRENLTLLVTQKRHAFDKLLQLLKKHKDEAAIIYCFSRKETEEIAEDLKHEGFNALPYHAGLEKEVRTKNQELFVKDEVPIIVATIAFGMGIDKPDIRLIAHYTFPKSLEGYYQEIGRAGRDGLPSECVLFYTYADVRKHEYFLDQIEGSAERERSRRKLQQVMDYAELSTCRRKYLLKYFGEEFTETNCDTCDICLAAKDTFDATQITQKILSCIIRTGQKFGMNHILNVLQGSRVAQVMKYQHEQLPVFGIVHDFDTAELKHIVAHLLNQELIAKSSGEYPTLAVTEKGITFLKNKEQIELPKLPQEELSSRRKQKGQLDYNAELFSKLRTLRKQLADERNVPPFVIFSDVALQEMAYYLPSDYESLGRISGVGQRKLEDFGDQFLEIITAHISENGLISLEVSDRSREKKRSFKRRMKRKGSNYQKTKEMIEQKMSLAKIAQAHGFKEQTIVGHLEKLLQAGEKLDIEYLQPPQKEFAEIASAFEEVGVMGLSPVFEFLGEKYSYDRIRLTRLFLTKPVSF